MSKYKRLKEQARIEAITFQSKLQEHNISYGELVCMQNYFYKLGKRYGLIKEFRENGIIQGG